MKDKLTRDATGQYRRDLGWKPTERGYAQHRFYLGRDLKRAKRIVRRLEVLWEQVVARWEQQNAEHRQRIFKVFERLHGEEGYPGTGIGLAIVKKGVERTGGRAGVESEPGQGSRFWVELPKLGGGK